MAGSAIGVGLLGSVRVEGSAGVSDLGGSRQRLLAGILAVEAGRPVDAGRLSHALWPGGGASPGALRVVVARVRSHIATAAPGTDPRGVLSKVAGGFTLAVDDDAIDARRFERTVNEGAELLRRGDAEGALASFTAALKCWTGAPFGELSDHEALRTEVERLEGLRRMAALRRCECLMVAHDYLSAIPELASVAGEHPFDEEATGLLMRALYASGRHGDALRAYQALRRTLASELGLEPTPQLRQLEQDILNHRLGDAVATPLQPARVASPLLWRRATDGDPALAGRDEELRAVIDGLGPGHLVAITGPPGIGKTRLLNELLARTGRPVVGGRCSPESWAAFAPFASVMAALPAIDTGPVASPEEGAVRQWHLFSMVATALEGLGPDLVVAVDDLQWADPGTVALVGHLLDSARPPAVVVASRRLAAGHAQPLAARMDRSGSMTVVELGPLSEAATRSVVDAVGGPDLNGWGADEICALAKGNPMWAVGLARHAANGAAPGTLPRTLDEAVGEQYSALSPPAQRLVDLAAVVGSGATFDMLSTHAGADGDTVAALDEVLRTGLLVTSTGSPDRLSFAHALTRKAVLDRVAPTRLAALHLAAARAFEVSGERRAALARSWHELHAVPLLGVTEATAAAVGPVEDAIAESAWGPATTVATRALDLHPPPSVAARLLLANGIADACSGRVDVARRAFDEALAAAIDANDSKTIGAVLTARQGFGHAVERDEDAMNLTTRAVTLLRRTGDRSALARALAAGIYEHIHQGDPAVLDSYDREAMALAEAEGDPGLMTEVLYAHHLILAARFVPPAERQVVARLGLRLAQQSGNLRSATRHAMAVVSGDLAESNAHAMGRDIEVFGAAVDALPLPSARWTLAGARTALALATDDLDEAERLAGEAFRTGVELGVGSATVAYGTHLLVLRWRQGRLDELIDLAAATAAEHPVLVGWQVIHAFCLAATGRPGALEILSRALEVRRRQHVRDWLWVPELVIAAETAQRVGSADEAALIESWLRPYSGQDAVLGSGIVSFGPVERALALLAVARGDDGRAAALFTEARERTERGGALAWSRQIDADLSRLGLGWGPATEAADPARSDD